MEDGESNVIASLNCCETPFLGVPKAVNTCKTRTIHRIVIVIVIVVIDY